MNLTLILLRGFGELSCRKTEGLSLRRGCQDVNGGGEIENGIPVGIKGLEEGRVSVYYKCKQ